MTKRREKRKCLSIDEAETYCRELISAGYDFWTMYIPSEMTWVFLITNDRREAADVGKED